jgi:hypothetical protein
MEARRCVKRAHRKGPMMKPRAAERPAFNDRHLDRLRHAEILARIFPARLIESNSASVIQGVYPQKEYN